MNKKISISLSANYPHSFKIYWLALIVILTTLRLPTKIGRTQSTGQLIPQSEIFPTICAAGTNRVIREIKQALRDIEDGV
jgi:hypothetical protein